MRLNIKQLRRLIREEIEKTRYSQTMETTLTANEVANQFPQLWDAFIEAYTEIILVGNEDTGGFDDPDVILAGEPNTVVANLRSLDDKQIVSFHKNENVVYINVWGDRGRFNEPILAMDTTTNQIWDVQEESDDIPEDIKDLIYV